MNSPAQPIKLYRFSTSGHSHRAELILSLLGLPVEPIDVDLLSGEQKTPAFLAMNAFGQVPVIQDGDATIPDSNAILVYLASRYGKGHWLPTDPVGAARVQRWLTVAAGLVAYGPCAARLITVFKMDFNAKEVIARAHGLLAVMDKELQHSPYLVGDEPSIADVANYSYIAHAPEGNVSLDGYPHVRAWLSRIEALPGFIAMPRTAAGLLA